MGFWFWWRWRIVGIHKFLILFWKGNWKPHWELILHFYFGVCDSWIALFSPLVIWSWANGLSFIMGLLLIKSLKMQLRTDRHPRYSRWVGTSEDFQIRLQPFLRNFQNFLLYLIYISYAERNSLCHIVSAFWCKINFQCFPVLFLTKSWLTRLMGQNLKLINLFFF